MPQAGLPRLAALRKRALRLLDPAAAAVQVAEAVLIVLLGVGQVLQAAGDVAAPEILLGVTVVFPRHAEILSRLLQVVVVMMMMVVAMAALATLGTLAAEEAAEHLADERHGKSCKTEHSAFSVSLLIPAPASCRRSGLGGCYADETKRIQ